MAETKKFNLNLLKVRKWYHQRFDGCPMFLFLVGCAELKKEKRKPAGTEADIRICFFDHGTGDWYLDMEDIKRGAKVIINLAKKDPNISEKLLNAWKKDEEVFNNFWRNFPRINLKELTTPELAEFWKKYCNLCTSRFSSSAIIDHFALGTDELICQMLRRELKGVYKKESDFTKLFSIATAPVRQSFINKAEIDLMKIAMGKSKETLAEYQKKNYWTKNNYYADRRLNIVHFKKEIQAWKTGGKDLNLELKRIAGMPGKNKREKDKLFKKYHLSSLLRVFLKISEDFIGWQDDRKRATYLNIDMGMKVLEEVAKRTGYKVEELKYAVPGELVDVLINRIPTKKELAQRVKSVFVATRERFYVATGNKVERVRKLALGGRKLSDLQDFRGLSASVGKAIGPVRIIRSATQINKVKFGDILVAVMTRPDYVIAMKKAAAVVTNEGGITSHAAIVSRELGIPCIIGTKIATEVLHDGDLVEVDANEGIVKILE